MHWLYLSAVAVGLLALGGSLRLWRPLGAVGAAVSGAAALCVAAPGASLLSASTLRPGLVELLAAGSCAAAVAFLWRTSQREAAASRRASLAERALTDLEQLARLGLWEWQPEAGRVIWSDALHRLFGLQPGTFEGRFESFLERVHPEARDGVREIIERSLETAESFELEERIVRADGEVRWLRSFGKVELGNRGQVARLRGACMDVTDQIRAREVVAESEARYRVMVEHAPEAIVVFDAESGHFVDCNEKALRLFGLDRAGLLELGPVDVSVPLQADGRESEAAAREYVRLALEGASPVFEWLHCNADGEPLECEVRLARLPPGDRCLIRGSVLDLRDRRRAEEELRRRDERLRVALSAAHMATWEWNVGAGEVRWEGNVLSLLGLEPQELGLSFEAAMAIVHPEDRQRVREAMERALVAGGEAEPLDVQHRIVRSGEEVRWLHLKGQMIRDDRGTPVRMVGTAMDISEHKNLESQLLQSQRMESIGRLAGGVAHDFNNLLTVILSEADLAGRQLGSKKVVGRALEGICSTAEQAGRLVAQLLAFARQQVFHLQVADLGAIVSSMEGLLRRLLGEDIELIIEPAEAEARCRVDRSQLEQVIVNLVVNAREAMPRGGTLWISVELMTEEERDEGASQVRLRVRDTGIGMRRQVLQHALEPFFTTKSKGTGLGLSTSYGIVRQHGGRLELRSRAGKGTCAEVWLPRVVEDPAAIEPGGGGSLEGSEQILVVEDEQEVRELTVRALRAYGYRPLAVAGGEEALGVLDGRPEIDLLVSDVVMPGIGGRELARRALKRRPELHVLLVSGYPADGESAMASLNGRVGFLQKPYSPQVLAREIRRVLDERPDP